jgi:hypothetical protein
MIIGAHSIEFYLMCDDVKAFAAKMGKSNITCGPVQNLGWGLLTRVMLPGGGKLGVYQPRHARPKAMSSRKAAKSPARRAAKSGSRRESGKRQARPARRRA